MRNVSGFKRGVEINTSGLYVHRMRLNAEPTVMPLVDPETDQRTQEVTDPGYLVICWDDPVNLMDYVTHVFQKVFGWERAKGWPLADAVQHHALHALERHQAETFRWPSSRRSHGRDGGWAHSFHCW